MRNHSLLLILWKLSATCLVPSAAGGVQLAAAWPSLLSSTSSSSTATSFLRRLSFADKTSDAFVPSSKTDETATSSTSDADAADSKGSADDAEADDSSTTTKKAASPEGPSASSSSSPTDDFVLVSPIMQKLTNYTNSTKKHHHSSKSKTTAVDTNSTTHSISEWDLSNTTIDPTNRTSNSTAILPPEQDQPAAWPVIVFGLFLLLAAVLFGATAVRNCRTHKRKNYEEIESLVV